MSYGFALIMFSFPKDLELEDCSDKELFKDAEELFSLPDSQPL